VEECRGAAVGRASLPASWLPTEGTEARPTGRMQGCSSGAGVSARLGQLPFLGNVVPTHPAVMCRLSWGESRLFGHICLAWHFACASAATSRAS